MKNELIYEEEKKLIIATGDPLVLFEEDPLSMMRAVRLVAETGFGFHGKIYKAILEKENLLATISADDIREEFERAITAEYAGKGLKMIAGTGLLKYFIGEHAEKTARWEADLLDGLGENIDKTKRIRLRRLALFYLCFNKKEALKALSMMNYDAETEDTITDALELLDKINFLATTFEIKQFIARHGFERYEFLHNLSKARRIVYDLDDAKIKSRHYLLEYIEGMGEPILVEDLKIDKNDIVMNEITSEDKADELLLMLLDLVHKEPGRNTKKELLAYAERYSKSPIQAAFRKVRWLR